MVTWFAGLFYIIRLFVYHAEAKEKPEPEKSILIKQYQLMQYRLWYIITFPGAILTSIFGFWLLFINSAWLSQPWMHVKLFFVFLLYLYHLKTHLIFLQFQKNTNKNTSSFFRIWNEGATLILFSVIFLVVLKNAVNWLYGVVGFFSLAMFLLIGYKWYKKIREKYKK